MQRHGPTAYVIKVEYSITLRILFMQIAALVFCIPLHWLHPPKGTEDLKSWFTGVRNLTEWTDWLTGQMSALISPCLQLPRSPCHLQVPAVAKRLSFPKGESAFQSKGCLDLAAVQAGLHCPLSNLGARQSFLQDRSWMFFLPNEGNTHTAALRLKFFRRKKCKESRGGRLNCLRPYILYIYFLELCNFIY